MHASKPGEEKAESTIELMEAVHAGDPRKVEKLLETGLNPNFTLKIRSDCHGDHEFNQQTPLHEAVVTTVKFLGEMPEASKRRGVDWRDSRVPDAISLDDMMKVIESLLRNGAVPQDLKLMDVFTSYYLEEYKEEKERIIRLLIGNGMRDYRIDFVARVLAVYGADGLVDFLMQNGLDLNAVIDPRSGLRLVHYLCANVTKAEILARLGEKGMELDPPLIARCEFVRETEAGVTPLMLACGNENVNNDSCAIARALIAGGANPLAETKWGDTPLSLAEKRRYDKLIAILKEGIEARG
jgi:hypothetical protein